MPLTMNPEVFITCAVTGSGATQDRSPHVPRSPREIAESAIAAAKAGAAVVHCHVRDPETGKPSRRLDLYREVTERIRDSATDVVLNLTAGMGGDATQTDEDAPSPPRPRELSDAVRRRCRLRGSAGRMEARALPPILRASALPRRLQRRRGSSS
jgi:uncharacterized protein (DUF849 family)